MPTTADPQFFANVASTVGLVFDIVGVGLLSVSVFQWIWWPIRLKWVRWRQTRLRARLDEQRPPADPTLETEMAERVEAEVDRRHPIGLIERENERLIQAMPARRMHAQTLEKEFREQAGSFSDAEKDAAQEILNLAKSELDASIEADSLMSLELHERNTLRNSLPMEFREAERLRRSDWPGRQPIADELAKLGTEEMRLTGPLTGSGGATAFLGFALVVIGFGLQIAGNWPSLFE